METHDYSELTLIYEKYEKNYDRLYLSQFCTLPKIDEIIQEKSSFIIVREYLKKKATTSTILNNEHIHLSNMLSFFNPSVDLLNKKCRKELAILNVKNSKKEKQNKSYNTAKKHSLYAKKCLGRNCWEENYDLSVDVHLDLVESLSKACNYDEAEKLFKIINSHLIDDLSKIALYYVQFMQYYKQERLEEANIISEKIKKLTK